MEPEGSLPRSKHPATCPYPEPDQSSPCSHLTSKRSIFILSSHLPSGLFPSRFPTKTLYTSILSPMRSFRNKAKFYGDNLLAPCPTSKMEDYPLSAFRDSLFNIFAVPPYATWGRALSWWQTPADHGVFCIETITYISFGMRLTFRHRSFSMQDRRFAILQRTLFIYLINKYISLFDTCLTVNHWYK